MNTQDWAPLGWTGWISLQSKGLSRVFNTTLLKHQFFGTQLSHIQLSHPYTTTGKTIALTRWTFVGKVMSLLCNMLSRLVITLLPRSKCLLISLLQSPSAVIFEPRKTKSATMSTVSPSICQEVMGPANRALPRECTGHSKHPLPTTQEKTLHMDIARWSTPKSDWLYSLQPKMEKLYTVSKNKTGCWLWLRSWTPYCQIQT